MSLIPRRPRSLICLFGNVCGGVILSLFAVTHLRAQEAPNTPAEPQAAATKVEGPEKWEAAIQTFEQEDAQRPPLKGQNLFVGSSSIRRWNLAESFPDHKCLNRGFGGSLLRDVAHFAPRLVLPSSPKVIVLYAGDNDIGQKRSPEQIREAYVSFVTQIRKDLPDTRIVWIAIKPSPKRWAMRTDAVRANALVKEAQAEDAHSVVVDAWQEFLGENGEPRPELYVADGLHLSPAGYAIWNRHIQPHLVTP